MSDEVTMLKAWQDQGCPTDEDGTPIPPREEAAIARVRKRLFGPGATPTGEPPEHYAVDELEDGAYQARMEPVPMDHMAYDQDPRGGCVAQCRAHREAVLASAADEPTPLPELEMAFDGVAMYVAHHPTTEQKAALYDHARAALEDTFGSCIATDPVATAAHEYRDATEEIPGEDHGMFLDDEMYHPLNEIVATLAGWWREGAAIDHELPAVDPLPEGARWETGAPEPSWWPNWSCGASYATDGGRRVHVIAEGTQLHVVHYRQREALELVGADARLDVVRAVLSRAKDS